jgi:hypothetical protein
MQFRLLERLGTPNGIQNLRLRPDIGEDAP